LLFLHGHITRSGRFLRRQDSLFRAQERRRFNGLQRPARCRRQRNRRRGNMVGQFGDQHDVIIAERHPAAKQFAAEVLCGLANNFHSILRVLDERSDRLAGI